MFNPVYHDDKAIAIALNLTKLIDNSSTWAGTDTVIVYALKKLQSLNKSTFA
jgi:hypothetical protein